MRSLSRLIPVLLFPAALASQSTAWPDFRGPSHNGHAPGSEAPLHWNEKKNVQWKVPIAGAAWSSPVVWDDQVWMTTASPKGRELGVIAVDLATGKTIHQRKLIENKKPDPKHDLNSYASPSPVIEAGRVYLHFGSYGTLCLDTNTAKTLWHRRDVKCTHVTGPGSSPILYEDLMVFHMDGTDVQYVIALDKKSGETRWKTKRSMDLSNIGSDMRRSFSTPIVITVEDKPRLVSTGSQATYCYNPISGNEVWRLQHKGFSNTSRPVFHQGRLFLNTGFMRPSLLAVDPSGQGDVTSKDDTIHWTYSRSVPTVPSPLIVGDMMFFVSDGGTATCLNIQTAKPHWKKRLGGEHSASLLYASKRIYAFDREGKTTVFAAQPKYQQLAINKLASGFMASAAVVGKAFVLRTKTHLYRIEADQD